MPRTQSDRGGVLVSGRATAEILVGSVAAVAGANAAYDTPDRFDVRGRLLLAAALRLRAGRVLVAGESIRERVETFSRLPTFSGLTIDGGYVTLGFAVTPDDRVLVRLDVLDDDREIVLGYNRTFTRAASFQVDLVAPLNENAGSAEALANFQLAF